MFFQSLDNTFLACFTGSVNNLTVTNGNPSLSRDIKEYMRISKPNFDQPMSNYGVRRLDFQVLFRQTMLQTSQMIFLRSNICFSIIITSPIFVLMNYDSNRKMCTVRWEDIDIPRSANYTLSKFERNYYSTLFSVTFILPSAILVIFYVMLSLKVHDKFCTFSSCFVILYMICLENLLKNKNAI